VTETEIKLPWNGTAADARTLIERHGYRVAAPRTLESDRLFDLPSGALRQSDRILRLREMAAADQDSPAGTRAMVTYKGAASRQDYKSREEIEFDVSDPAAFVLVLERLGYRPTFSYQKYRTQFRTAGEPGLVTIDETPIGVYLELEGPEMWIDSTSTRLGFQKSQFVTASYAALYRLHREQHPEVPRDMTFDLDAP
jgi:adenylate cyclase class 2